MNDISSHSGIKKKCNEKVYLLNNFVVSQVQTLCDFDICGQNHAHNVIGAYLIHAFLTLEKNLMFLFPRMESC